MTVPMHEYGCAPVLQESLGTIAVWSIPCLLHLQKIQNSMINCIFFNPFSCSFVPCPNPSFLSWATDAPKSAAISATKACAASLAVPHVRREVR